MRHNGNLSQFSVRVGNNIIEFELDIFILIDINIMTAVLTNSNYIKLGESDTGDEISKSVRYINYMLRVGGTIEFFEFIFKFVCFFLPKIIPF